MWPPRCRPASGHPLATTRSSAFLAASRYRPG
jgi:hypothetical protein